MVGASAPEAETSPTASGCPCHSTSSASALTLGIRRSSETSSRYASATEAESRALRDFAKPLRVREGAKLPQRLVLDLPDPLAGDVERAADLIERERRLPVQAVAQLDD